MGFFCSLLLCELFSLVKNNRKYITGGVRYFFSVYMLVWKIALERDVRREQKQKRRSICFTWSANRDILTSLYSPLRLALRPSGACNWIVELLIISIQHSSSSAPSGRIRQYTCIEKMQYVFYQFGATYLNLKSVHKTSQLEDLHSNKLKLSATSQRL